MTHRRRFPTCPAFVSLLSLTLLWSSAAPTQILSYIDSRLLMGTLVTVVVEGPRRDVLEQGVNDAYREMSRLSDMMNHYDPDSMVSAINRCAGKRPLTVPPELMEVLVMARRVSERTEGAFDITVGSLKAWRFNLQNPAKPSAKEIEQGLSLVNFRNVVLDEADRSVLLKRSGMRIDLGGIAKLYILNAGMQVLKQHGIAHAMVNGGGDVAVMGTRDGRPWRIGIRHPRRDDALLATLELTRGWVVTSGDYERYFAGDGRRYHHILDPHTGYPSLGPQQVTLVADDYTQVNGYTTAVMVLGADKGRDLLGRSPGVEGIFVEPTGRIWVSPDLEARLGR